MKNKTSGRVLVIAALVSLTFLLCTSSAIVGASDLNLTLETDENSYEKGQTIRVSGTVKDAENTQVGSGTATVQFSNAGWSQTFTVQIADGAYSYEYSLPYGSPSGTWTITVNATDGAGNTGSTSKTVSGSSPDNEIYMVSLTSPDNSINYSRGKTLTISATVNHGENNPVDNAVVVASSPTGENFALSTVATGSYQTSHTLDFDAPAGSWTLWVEARKTTDNTFRAGGAWINVQVVPATLTVELQKPTQTKVNVGENIAIEVKVSYPFGGGVVENAAVSVNEPTGETLNLKDEGSGIYSTSYVPQEETSWSMNFQASDGNGNSGQRSKLITVVVPSVPGLLEEYWWALLGVVLAGGVVSVYVARGKHFETRLVDVKREMKEIPRLKKDAAIKYFKEGSISREAYNKMVKEYDARMDELKKEEAELKSKMKKTGRKKII